MVEQKVEELLTLLQNAQVVRAYQESKQQVLKSQKLYQQIKTYHQTGDEALKQQILKHPLYQQYQQCHSNLSILIWGMNLKFQRKEETVCGLSKGNTKDAS